MGEYYNRTEYIRTFTRKCESCKQGFVYVYRYYNYLHGQVEDISSTDIKKLEEKVKKRGLPWRKRGD